MTVDPSLARWNDAPQRTHREISDLLRHAEELAMIELSPRLFELH